MIERVTRTIAVVIVSEGLAGVDAKKPLIALDSYMLTPLGPPPSTPS